MSSDKLQAESMGWVVHSTRYLHKSPWYDVRQDAIRLPEGQERTYTYIEHPGSVFVVPVLEDGRVLLIRSYRYTLDDWCWEVPAGGIGDKPGADAHDVARQELAEEVGGSCRELVELGRFSMGNGHAHHRVRFFLALGVELNRETRLEDLEVIERAEAFTFDDVLAMIGRSEIDDGDSVLALLLASRHVGVGA